MNIQDRCHLADEIYNGMNNISWPANAQEPDIVAKLVTELPKIIKSSFSSLSKNYLISVGGAFIHQKPIAHFLYKSGNKDPELGDLLIVCRDKRASGYVYNALLLQAKVSTNLFNESIPQDHQFVLYSEWPEFEYRRAGNLNGTHRNVLPKTITQGAQYLLIKKTNRYEMLTATVDAPLSGSRCFSITLASVISFDDGRTFQVIEPKDDWSRMILDLLNISATSVFNRKNAGFSKTKRWTGYMAFEYLLNSINNGETFIVDNKDNDGYYSGVSVIYIDINTKD